MAEIKIKKKGPIWPWLLLVVIALAAIAYYFLVYNGGLIKEGTNDIGPDYEIENGTGRTDQILNNIYFFDSSVV